MSILDLGCGPGRDLLAFTALGHEVTGLDGAAELVALARAETDCPVLHQDFLALDLPPGRISTGFSPTPRSSTCRAARSRACSSELAAALKPGGVLFCSNPQRRQPGRLGRWPLRLLLGPCNLARLCHRRGFRRIAPLLPSTRAPPPPTALARHRLAQEQGRSDLPWSVKADTLPGGPPTRRRSTMGHANGPADDGR